MRIERFLSCAVAADGGTIACQVLLGDGTELALGLDGRIPKRKSERLIFVGAGYPTLAGARHLARGGEEEAQVIAAIDELIARSSGGGGIDGEPGVDFDGLSEEGKSVWMAKHLRLAIADRVDPAPRESWLP